MHEIWEWRLKWALIPEKFVDKQDMGTVIYFAEAWKVN